MAIVHDAEYSIDGGAWTALFTGDSLSPGPAVDTTGWVGSSVQVRLKRRDTSDGAVSPAYSTFTYTMSGVPVVLAAEGTVTLAGSAGLQSAKPLGTAGSLDVTAAAALTVGSGLAAEGVVGVTGSAALQVEDPSAPVTIPVLLEFTPEEVYVGSRARVVLTFTGQREDGTVGPIDLSATEVRSVRIVKPYRSGEINSPALVVTDAAAGKAYWDAAAGVIDRAGPWKAQGIADGFRSKPVTIRVHRNP